MKCCQSQNILLIRHAESQYNVQQRLLNQDKSKEVHWTNEDLDLKFNQELIDCPTSQFGKDQCQIAKKQLQNQNIQIVLCSPLRRCLDTCYELFQDHKSNPKIIVAPNIREYIQSNCDLGANILQSQKLYPSFDYNLIEKYKYKSLWFIDTLVNDSMKKNLWDMILNKCSEDDQIENQGPLEILNWMKKNYPTTIENPEQLNIRVNKVKQQCLPNIIHQLDCDKKLAIVTHSRFLWHFIGTQFDNDHNPINAKWFENCEIREHFFQLASNKQKCLCNN